MPGTPSPNDYKPLATEAYKLYRLGDVLVVEGGGQRGVLNRTFALLCLIAEEHSLAILGESSNPGASVRWTNEWDNPMDQSSAAMLDLRSSSKVAMFVRPYLVRQQHMPDC